MKTKCKICGCAMLTVIFLNSYPICRDCFVKLREIPDIPNMDKSAESRTNVTNAAYSVQVSASDSSTTTTTQPPIVD